MNPSLHRRLLVLVAVSSVLTLAVSGVIVSVLVESRLWQQFDDGLRDRLYSFTQLVEQDADRVDVEWNDFGPNDTSALDSASRVTCWYKGRVLANYPPGTQPLSAEELPSDSRVRNTVLEGQPARILSVQFVPKSEGDQPGDLSSVVVAIARPTIPMLGTIRIVRMSAVAATMLGMVIASIGAWIAVGRGLAPIQTAAQQIAQVTPDRLDHQIEYDVRRPIELQPLVDTINRLLRQLQLAMERERTLSSEIAHELRTPLAGLRAKLDVARSRERHPDELRQTMDECATIVNQTSRMIESLLATVVARVKPDVAGRTNLSAIVEEYILQFDERMTERSLALDHQIDTNVLAKVDELAARTVLNNLFDNAMTYAELGSTIEVSCVAAGDKVCLRIRNVALEFPDGPVEQVFARFWRGDRSRSGVAGHHGLGLALTKRVVEAAGGKIEAKRVGTHFEILVEWPSYGNSPLHIST
ncbi:MAG: GHKL domain-containing protein [Planctomycetales bacterium]|nr:GHKL domain-containing protein [Planctomycetales bacterium]